MDFRFSTEDDAFRRELVAFLQQELTPDWQGEGRWPEEAGWVFTFQMRRKLAQKGWLTMHWPPEYGGEGRSPVRSAIFNEEMSYNRAPGRDIFGVRMLAPTLMIFGTEEQKKTFLSPVARGEVQWCQGYSELGSGSDLASLQTRAVSDGDDYVVNGSKIWTTFAHQADWIMPLCLGPTPTPRGTRALASCRRICVHRASRYSPFTTWRMAMTSTGVLRQREGTQEESGWRGERGLVRGGQASRLRAFRDRIPIHLPQASQRASGLRPNYPPQR